MKTRSLKIFQPKKAAQPVQPMANPVVEYTPFFSSYTLAEYESKLGAPGGNATSRTNHCSDSQGSFLATYLESNLAKTDYSLDYLNSIVEQINALKAKGCVIDFNKTNQLPRLFDALVDHLPLYFALLNQHYLTVDLQCDNGDTFLHRYFAKMIPDSEASIKTVMSLVLTVAPSLALKNNTNIALLILLEKMPMMLAQVYEDTKIAMGGLLQALTQEVKANVLSPEQQSALLKACFALIGCEDRANKLIGFQAAIAAASYGMPVDVVLKGAAGEKSILALLMESDAEYQWPHELMRAMVLAGTRAALNVTVQTNVSDVKHEFAEVQEPESAASYACVPDFTPEEKEANTSSLLNPKCLNTDKVVVNLTEASRYFMVSHIIEGWKKSADTLNDQQVHQLSVSYHYLTPLGEKSPGRKSWEYIYGFYINLSKVNLASPDMPQDMKYFHEAWDHHKFVEPDRLGYYQIAQGYSGLEIQKSEVVGKNRFGATEYLRQNTKHSTLNETVAQATRVYEAVQKMIVHSANWRLLADYYHRSRVLQPAPQSSNALLAYLEKGGSCLAPEQADPRQYFHFQRQFKSIAKVSPRLVLDVAGVRKICAVYEEVSTGEKLAFVTKPEADEFTMNRVYDTKVLAHFKGIGFDFSVDAVTKFIEALVKNSKPSPSLYHLLRCLNECGAVFPKTVNGESFTAFMSRAFIQHQAFVEASCVAMFEWLAPAEARDATVQYLHAFSLTALLGQDITSPPTAAALAAYVQQFEANMNNVLKPMLNYPLTLVELAYSLHWHPETAAPSVQGSAELLFKALNAYLASNDFMMRDLERYEDYYTVFIEAAKERHQVLCRHLEVAMGHVSDKGNWLTKKSEVAARAIKVGKIVDKIRSEVSEITIYSPGNADRMVEVKEKIGMMKRIVDFETMIADAVKEIQSKSVGVTKCLNDYLSGVMFKNVTVIFSLPLRASLGHVLPPSLKPIIDIYLRDDGHNVADADARPSAPPLEYQQPGKSDALSVEQPLQPAPKAPVATSLYPSKAEVQADRFAQYKAELDARVYSQFANIDDVISYLNENIASLRANQSYVNLQIDMMICQETNMISKYPCYLATEQNHSYDLDDVLASGKFEQDNILLPTWREIAMTVALMMSCKEKLESVPVESYQAAYTSPRMG